MKKYEAAFLKTSCVIICILLGLNNLFAANVSTTGLGDGKWSSTSTWSSNPVTGDDNITINHPINIDVNWGPQNSGSVVFNANSSGAGTLNMSGGTLDIKANVTLTGTGVNLTGGTIHVYSGYTLTIPGFNQANTNIIVDAGAVLIVNGNLLDNHGNINVNGLITVKGDYKGQAGDANVTGSGNITSTGSMIGINNSSIFGTPNPNCPSNCDGRNLFGGGGCSGTAAATANQTTTCLGGIISFTASLTGGYNNSNPLVYQWQVKTGSGFFENISGATLSTYLASPPVSQSFRVVIGEKLNSGDPYCYKYSPAVNITVSPCPKNWVGGTPGALTNWNNGGNWSPSGVPGSTDNVIISSSTYYPVIPSSSTAIARNVTISSGSSLTFSSNSTLNVYGNISNSGTITTVPGSTINMVGTASQTITGLSSVYDLSINNNNGTGVSLLSPLTVNGSLFLISGLLTTNNNLTLNFDAGGNIGYHASDAGNINGNVSGVRNLVAKTHFIATPFVGVTSGQISASTPIYNAPTGAWLLSTKTYNTQSWSVIRNYSTTLSPGVGYALGMFNPASLTMTGTYNHTATYSSGNYTNTIPAAVTQGMYFMVGNPYPSTLDWDNASGWTKNNIDDAVYYWNPLTSSVASYVSGVGTNGGTRYIPAMQSFLISVTGTGGFASLSINNKARVLTNASYFRSTSSQIARLVVKNASGSSTDETVVRLDELSSSEFESGSDAYKVHGALSLYTKPIGTATGYSINTLPITGPELLVPLNLKVAVSGLYTIQCSEYSVPGYSMILEDKLTQSYTLMDNSTIYTINASNTDSTGRFVLRFVAGLTTGVVNSSNNAVQISTYDNQLMLNTSGVQDENATINVFDASGLEVKTLTNQRIVSGLQTFGGFEGLTPGVYIVKILTDGNTHVGKLVLK